MDAATRKEIFSRGGTSIPWGAEPHLGGNYGQEEIDTVVKCMHDSMDYNVGFGFITDEILNFEAEFAKFIGTKYALTINGAGAGMDMVLRTLELEPEDEVIVPTLNFSSCPQAVIGEHAKLILCDCDPRTFQADPADVEKRITKNTRAIFPVHMNGMSAPIADLEEVASRHKHHKHGEIVVFTDAARSLGGEYKGQQIGCAGKATVFSFHTMKNMTTLGEGGAIVTDDDYTFEYLKGIRQFGNDTSGWGSNYKMTRVQAAVGMVQLRRLPSFIAGRRKVAADRNEMLAGIPHLTLPYVPEDCNPSWYLYTLLVPEDWAGEKRDQLLTLLRDEYGVDTVVANPPVQYAKKNIAEATKGQETPVSDLIGKRLFCVPTHPMMPREDNEHICAALWDAVEKMS